VGVLPVFNWEGLSVAPGSTIFDDLPSWTRLDNMGGGLRVAEVSIRRGRQDEFERHDTGTMTVRFNDRSGDADPTLVDWISRPIAFAVRNPVTGEWHPRYRGAVDDHSYELDPSGRVKGSVVVEAVDALDYFANFGLAPGLAGDPPPPQSEGFVFFEDTESGGGGSGGPQIRITQALTNANWSVAMSSIFTGETHLLEGVYSPGESILTVIQDAAEADFPTIGAFLIDRYGVACYRGRNARFDPAGTAATATHWDFHEWVAGTGAAQIRPPFVPTRSRRLIRNAAMCYPNDIRQQDRINQVAVNSGSISSHGYRSWAAENLLTKSGIATGNTGPLECRAFADYIVANYSVPVTRIGAITFRALWPSDIRAPEVWDLVTQVDIGDQITVTRAHPGGGGFVDEICFVEGITETWRPGVFDLDTGFPFLTMTLDLSPSTFWQFPIE
jgi:hypothetical protein